MTTMLEQPQTSQRGRPRRLLWAALAGVTLLFVVGLVVLVTQVQRGVPTFRSLAQHPDPSIRGTVAYLDDRTSCIRMMAAAGGPSKQVYCLPPTDVGKAQALGKEQGPQLVWLPGGRLQVTMFRMTDPPGPWFNPGWQKVVDVRTGTVTDVPAATVPSQPDLSTRPRVNPAGQRVVTSSDSDTGRVRVTLVNPDGSSRLLLNARGPGNQTYQLLTAFWAPTWDWIAADDGRILVIRPSDPPVTRLLTGDSAQVRFGGGEPQLARFAVTAQDLMPSPSEPAASPTG